MARVDFAHVLVLGLTSFLQICPAEAQGITATNLEQAAVIVVVSGVDTAANNTQKAVQGTGFFINSQGLLVTSDHLRTKLGPTVEPGSIEYRIHFDNFSLPIPARQIFSGPEVDLMLLYAPVGNRPIKILPPVSKNEANIILAKTPVYAISFVPGYPISVTPGVVTSFSGPVQPLIPSWLTNHSFSEGQSGSPIILSDGRVVAIAKASDANNPTIGIVVPVMYVPAQYWENSAAAAATRLVLASTNEPFSRLVISTSRLSSRPKSVAWPIEVSMTPCDDRNNRLSFKATPGWMIAPESIKLTTRKFSYGQNLKTEILTPRADGFELNITADGWGTCVLNVPVGATTSYQGELSYQEVPVSPTAQNVVLSDSVAVDGLKIPVGTPSDDLRYVLITKDGKQTPVVPKNSDFKGISGARTLDVKSVLDRESAK